MSAAAPKTRLPQHRCNGQWDELLVEGFAHQRGGGGGAQGNLRLLEYMGKAGTVETEISMSGSGDGTPW